MSISRRAFLGSAGVAGLALANTHCAAAPLRTTPNAFPPLDRPTGSADAVARDEEYWRRVAEYYRVPSEYTNLEAGYFGMMASPVLAEFHRQVDRVNFASSYFARRAWGDAELAVRTRAATFFGAAPNELVFTRNATEALQRLIVQYRGLRPGDAVMYSDLDYQAMQFAMDALAELRGVKVVRFNLPEPATRDNILAAYQDALRANPQVRLLLLTHLNNKTGLMIPTKEITAMARQAGADTIVDAAHSFGQVNLKLEDIGADFVGMNLHKWIGAPIGAGAMYIKANRLADMDRMLGDDGALDKIESRMHTGTMNFGTLLTIPAAIDFHESIGAANKAARLHYLRNEWVSAARGIPGIEILTPDDPAMVAAITSFRVLGRTNRAQNTALANELLEKYQIFTVARNGPAKGDCVRVTPALYNTPADADRLARALKDIAK